MYSIFSEACYIDNIMLYYYYYYAYILNAYTFRYECDVVYSNTPLETQHYIFILSRNYRLSLRMRVLYV